MNHKNDASTFFLQGAKVNAIACTEVFRQSCEALDHYFSTSEAISFSTRLGTIPYTISMIKSHLTFGPPSSQYNGLLWVGRNGEGLQ